MSSEEHDYSGLPPGRPRPSALARAAGAAVVVVVAYLLWFVLSLVDFVRDPLSDDFSW